MKKKKRTNLKRQHLQKNINKSYLILPRLAVLNSWSFWRQNRYTSVKNADEKGNIEAKVVFSNPPLLLWVDAVNEPQNDCFLSHTALGMEWPEITFLLRIMSYVKVQKYRCPLALYQMAALKVPSLWLHWLSKFMITLFLEVYDYIFSKLALTYESYVWKTLWSVVFVIHAVQRTMIAVIFQKEYIINLS